MNYRDLKAKNKEYLELSARIEALRTVAEKTTRGFSQAPARSSGSGKAEVIDEIVFLTSELDELTIYLDAQKEKLKSSYEGNCIILHVFGKYSWRKIAQRVGGGVSEDVIRKMCCKFKWE